MRIFRKFIIFSSSFCVGLKIFTQPHTTLSMSFFSFLVTVKSFSISFKGIFLVFFIFLKEALSCLICHILRRNVVYANAISITQHTAISLNDRPQYMEAPPFQKTFCFYLLIIILNFEKFCYT